MANHNRMGMTAVEVLAATLLSALLMVAVIGVIRGLKAHERALDLRDPTASWQRSLAAILQQDLASSQTLEVTPQSIVLKGFGTGDWLPRTIRYEVHQRDSANWLIRRESSSLTRNELVCRDVVTMSIFTDETPDPAHQSNELRQQPVVSGLTIQFWGTDGMPIFQFEFHQT